VVEGEIDALSVYQAFGGRYAVVSVPKGAVSAKNAVAESLEWLNGFKEVVFAFDQDDAGKKAMEECAALFEPGKSLICNWAGGKDANELLVEGKVEELKKCIWGAQSIKPQGIITASDISDTDIEDLFTEGFDLPFPMLNVALNGLRERQVITIMAPPKVGKTTVTKEIALHVAKSGQTDVGLLYLEEDARRETISLAGMELNKPMWQLENMKEDAKLKEDVLNKCQELGELGLYIYDHKGMIDSKSIFNTMNYMAKGLGCKLIILDNLSISSAGESGGEGERRMLDKLMYDVKKLALETKCCIINIIHVRKNRGSGDADGEDRMILRSEDAHGTGAFAKFSNVLIGLERQTQSTVALKVLENRTKGSLACGYMDVLQYNASTGRLEVVESVIGE
jgi:twinkle protein